jgi:Helix-turn-helix domain
MPEHQLPDFLTIEEAAAILRIGRTSAYALARQFLASNGEVGLPVVRLGHQLRVPRHRLEQLLGGPITWPVVDTLTSDTTPRTSSRTTSRTSSTAPSKASGTSGRQSRLFSVKP